MLHEVQLADLQREIVTSLPQKSGEQHPRADQRARHFLADLLIQKKNLTDRYLSEPNTVAAPVLMSAVSPQRLSVATAAAVVAAIAPPAAAAAMTVSAPCRAAVSHAHCSLLCFLIYRLCSLQ